MKTLFLASALLLASNAAHAGEHIRCQTAVERQEKSLASESLATPQDKAKLIKQLADGEFTTSKREDAQLLPLLQREDTLAFSFSNDAGTWLSIADAKSCKVLLTLQAVEK